MDDRHTDQFEGDAEYVFSIRARITAADPDVRVEPAVVETTLFKRAPRPGDDGWLFFRDHLWRGEINDEAPVRALATDALDLDVDAVSFRELRTDETYYEALKDEIAANLELFNATDVAEVVNKYLGSSVHVREK